MGLRIDQKIVIVTRATQLASLKRKYATRSQAKFKIVSAKKRELARAGAAAAAIDAMAGAVFDEIDAASEVYDETVARVRSELEEDNDIPVQSIDRDFVPNFLFGPKDIVVTIGQDGLVANTAKYVLGRPIVAVNPDPARIDGILLPLRANQASLAVRSVLRGQAKFREVTLAQAMLDDGQRLLAFNELFIGSRSHVSARYRLEIGGKSESQSSSGILVCTGAGSSGWLSSVFKMAGGLASVFPAEGSMAKKLAVGAPRIKWEDPRLVFVVREPFVSRTSSANIIAGIVEPAREIVIESNMPADGVIFSDGVEADFLQFNSGAIARITAAENKAKLVVL
jgi:NAD kinase